MAIQITEKCIRHQHQWSNCHRCASACPEQAVEFSPHFAINANQCTQCEICISACPFEAIENDHKDKQGKKQFSRRSFLGLKEPEIPQISDYSPSLFHIEFKTEKCELCGLCEKYCYKDCIQISADSILINSQHCNGCRLCVDICRPEALHIQETAIQGKPSTYPLYQQQCAECHQPYRTMMKTIDSPHLCPVCLFRRTRHTPIYKIGQSAVDF